MTLPYDIARCAGTTAPICRGCRRKERGSPHRQSFIAPAVQPDGTCAHKINPPPAVVFSEES
jgi:hypothetical protein